LLETEQNNLLSITSSLVTKQVTQNITSHSSLSLSLYSFKFNYQSDILRHLFSPSTVTIPNTPLTFITFYHFATYLFNAVTPWLPTTTIHIHSFKVWVFPRPIFYSTLPLPSTCFFFVTF
jgi:hypothetical protein